jgi:hypothetical protein
MGTVVTNTGVVTWNTPTQTASASVSITVAASPGSPPCTARPGTTPTSTMPGPGRAPPGRLGGGLYRDGLVMKTVLTDASGNYQILGVEPNQGTATRYELRFRAPGAGATTAMLGRAASPFTNGPSRSPTSWCPRRQPAGAEPAHRSQRGRLQHDVAPPRGRGHLTLLDAGSGSPLPLTCFDDAAQQGQVTLGGATTSSTSTSATRLSQRRRLPGLRDASSGWDVSPGPVPDHSACDRRHHGSLLRARLPEQPDDAIPAPSSTARSSPPSSRPRHRCRRARRGPSITCTCASIAAARPAPARSSTTTSR